MSIPPIVAAARHGTIGPFFLLCGRIARLFSVFLNAEPAHIVSACGHQAQKRDLV
jgi:hypothetical protein